MTRETWTSRTVAAWCQDCGWTAESKNAQGIAAQHHDRTGHLVDVEIYLSVSYGDSKNRNPDPPTRKG